MLLGKGSLSIASSELGQEELDSLIPRLSPAPVFDRLRYTKMEREGLGMRLEGGCIISVDNKYACFVPRVYYSKSVQLPYTCHLDRMT